MLKIWSIWLFLFAFSGLAALAQNDPFDRDRTPIEGLSSGLISGAEKQVRQLGDEVSASLEFRKALIDKAEVASLIEASQEAALPS